MLTYLLLVIIVLDVDFLLILAINNFGFLDAFEGLTKILLVPVIGMNMLGAAYTAPTD